jgi:hypothetical protein
VQPHHTTTAVLGDHAVCPATRIEITAADDLAARYEQHLQAQQGLAATTIKRYRPDDKLLAFLKGL